jgi:hypothetical protein
MLVMVFCRLGLWDRERAGLRGAWSCKRSHAKDDRHPIYEESADCHHPADLEIAMKEADLPQ